MRIVYFGTRDYDRESVARRLPDFPELEVAFVEENLSLRTVERATGAAAVCAFVGDDLSAPVLQALAATGVRLILLRCAGFDMVDVAEAERLGLTVARVPAYSPAAVAEHAMGLAQAANRHICEAYERFRGNDFSLVGLLGATLEGSTAGVIGTGHVGAAFCRICKGYGMRVLAYDVVQNRSLVDELGWIDAYVSLSELFERADLVSLHVPLTTETHHLIDDAAIARMRQGVVFVNTSRGALVDTQALVRGLESGKLGAVGLDVYEEETPYLYKDCSAREMDRPSGRLTSFPNVVMTSHQAFLTYKSLTQIARVTLANASAFGKGERLVDGSVVCG